MSIASEITRLQNAKADIKTSIESKGVTVPSTTKLDGYSTLIDSIQTGITPTGTISITTNGTVDVTNYASADVNVSGGGGTGDDVVFIDYDGTVLYKYSKAEIDAMSALPSNPTHTGLTSQGWNWTKQQILTQLTAYPDQQVYVGQMYITDDGDTRLYVHFEEGRTSPYLGLGVNGTVTIDWGDNSATDTLAGTSLTTAKTIKHIYQAGDYVIKLTPTSGSFSIFGTSTMTHILKVSSGTLNTASRVYANALQKIELGDVTLGNVAFSYCSSLTSVSVPSGVTSIGSSAFSYCSSLASVTIPRGVTSIGSSAFSFCSSLASVSVPSGVTSIGNGAFSSCYSLASVTIPRGVTSIGLSSAFSFCSSLASVTIPSGVTSISSSAFSSCSSLASVTIPSGVTSIDSSAFSYCSSLTSITIPSGVTSISKGAFNSCYSLASVTIPRGVTSIGSNAFFNCYGMAEYHFLSTTPPTLDNINAFNNIQSDCIIYVPYSANHSILNAYKTASNWSTYASYMQEEPQ